MIGKWAEHYDAMPPQEGQGHMTCPTLTTDRFAEITSVFTHPARYPGIRFSVRMLLPLEGKPAPGPAAQVFAPLLKGPWCVLVTFLHKLFMGVMAGRGRTGNKEESGRKGEEGDQACFARDSVFLLPVLIVNGASLPDSCFF